MRVYNITTAQFGLSNLALRRLKIARFSELNDPFELIAVDLSDTDHRAGFSAKKKLINESEGLVCFSRAWCDPLLWSHYGDSHYGICLGFDVPDKLLVPVKYVKGLHKIDLTSPSTKQEAVDQLLKKLRYTKFYGWKYEDEVRQFVDLCGLNPQSGLYFLPFSHNLVLREVILGHRCDLPIDSVREIVKSFVPYVRVIKSRLAFKKFAVVR
jgi:Protein of unknown function (DUF2971)